MSLIGNAHAGAAAEAIGLKEGDRCMLDGVGGPGGSSWTYAGAHQGMLEFDNNAVNQRTWLRPEDADRVTIL